MSTTAAIAHNRFGLGIRPGDTPVADPKRWLITQFTAFEPRPAAIAAVPGSAAMATQFRQYLAQIRPFLAANTEPRETAMMTDTKPPGEAQENAIRRELRRQFRDNYGGQARARVTSALTTNAPFTERLVHFWANHFAVSADKLQTIGLAGTLEFEAIRPNITGTFADLLMATLTHPAMLLYLDQAQSIGPDSPLGQAALRRNARRKPGLNENLAREILELHTLGVGNYAQSDVLELARGLTGFSLGGFVRRPIGIEAPDGAFVFQPNWHQPGARQLLGRRYDQQGLAQPRAMLADLAVHPATARHLATKLARHFVSDTPPPALVDRLAAAHIASGGDLMTLYRTLVDAPEAWATPLPKFKTPWDWTISALRATRNSRPRLARRRRTCRARPAGVAPRLARRLGRCRSQLGGPRSAAPPRRNRRPPSRRPPARATQGRWRRKSCPASSRLPPPRPSPAPKPARRRSRYFSHPPNS